MKETINEFVMYLKKIRNISDNTVKSYTHDLIQLCDHMNQNGRNEWRAVTEDDMTEYVSSLAGQGYASATVARHIASMKSFFSYMLETGDIDVDITELMNAPVIEKKLPVILTPDEVDMLLNQPDRSSVKGKRDAAMLELLYATGMRVSELISLKVSEIDFQINCVICENSRKNRRTIPFGMRARKAVVDYLEHSRKELAHAENDNDFLFLNCRDGNSMSRQGFWKLIKSYGKSACIKTKITPYTLRHSFAVHLIENGAELKFVQEMLGHAELSSTSRYAPDKHGYMREIYTRTQKRG